MVWIGLNCSLWVGLTGLLVKISYQCGNIPVGFHRTQSYFPMLFNIYVNLLGEKKHFQVWCRLLSIFYIYLFRYAVEVLNLTDVVNWLKINTLKLSPDKTEGMFVGDGGVLKDIWWNPAYSHWLIKESKIYTDCSIGIGKTC